MSKIAVGSTDIEWVPKRPNVAVDWMHKLRARRMALAWVAFAGDPVEAIEILIDTGLWTEAEAKAEVASMFKRDHVPLGLEFYWGGGK